MRARDGMYVVSKRLKFDVGRGWGVVGERGVVW
jgi:hypothetical protein